MSKKPIVCIDSGHYGKYNRCPGIPEYYESQVMWRLHLMQKKYLEQLGIDVITTRKDLSVDLALHLRGMKSKGCNLFISDHSNAVGGGMNENTDFVAIYHLVNDTTTDADDISKEVAEKLGPVIAEIMGVRQGYKVLTRQINRDRNGDGIMNDNYYGVLHGAHLVKTPGLIIEHSFHTNSKTVRWLLDDNNLDRLAKVEAECIASYLLKKPVSVSIVGDYELVFDANYYCEKYTDLKAAFGNDKNQLFNHFMMFGMKEGRQAISTFNVHAYKNKYIDLQKAFGDDLPKYYQHYIQFGYVEKRTAI